MEKKLILPLFFVFSLGYSQNITKFTSNPLTDFTIVNPSSGIDQLPSGMDAMWTFDNLNATGTNIDSYAAPNGSQSTTFPGTTTILTVTTQDGTPTTNDLLLRVDGTGTYITGIIQEDLTLNYNTTNAFIGVFPLSFGTNNSGNVSGTFSYQGNSGTFTGTFTATIDAYGILTIPGDYSETVTRLSITQNLSFSIPPLFNNIGTLSQTSYYYYGNTSDNIDFRYNNISLVSGFLGINVTNETYERNTVETLSNSTINANTFSFYPNPVKDVITINLDSTLWQNIDSASIFNVEGRKITKKTNDLNSISVQGLEKGIYFLALKSKSGTITSKAFIKN
ncbi:T9SS type A sorting domain-containing protein [Hyunsoonleella pacifica]|nr:T9SS type A sorting domain-containing protein [Hyunsoonleella pacifica]GGD25307.1 hypothetical protein GCM10011368_29220 [Hyunsoonleella pacifica]